MSTPVPGVLMTSTMLPIVTVSRTGIRVRYIVPATGVDAAVAVAAS